MDKTEVGASNTGLPCFLWRILHRGVKSFEEVICNTEKISNFALADYSDCRL